MRTPEEIQQKDQDLRRLLSAGHKKYHSSTAEQSKYPKLTILLSTLLLCLTIYFIIFFINSDTKLSLTKDNPLSYSFIDISHKPDFEASNDEIIKPITDDKIYRTFELPNGMKVVAISDPSSARSSAAVNVQVGHFSDPKEAPGLAHLCEHIIFMSSKEYPEVNGFQRFVSNYGGDTNAFTQEEDTNYHFEITSAKFSEALKRFSRFFIDPIFTKDLIEDEIHSIDGELNRNLNDEGWRMSFVIQLASNPKSPYGHFSCGSSATLIEGTKEAGIDIAKELQDFYDRYYSANLMTLAVVDSRPIDEIEELIREVFSEVPNKEQQRPDYSELVDPLSGNYSNRLIQYHPADPSDSLRMIFTVDSSKEHPYVDTLEYFSRLLLNREKGGLSKVLNKEGYIFDMSAGPVVETSEFELFMIELGLKEGAIERIEDITKIVFGFIDLVKREGIKEELYEQYSQVMNYTFNYLQNGRLSMDAVSDISLDIDVYPAKYIISGSNGKKNTFDEKVMTNLLDQINVDNLVLLVSSPDFKVSTDSPKHEETKHHKKIHFKDLDQHSSLYNIDYAITDTPSHFLDGLRKVTYEDYPKLKLPGSNQFMSKDFKLVDKPCKIGTLKCVQDYQADADQIKPNKILENDYIRVWHQLDRSNEIPQVYGTVVFYSEDLQEDIFSRIVSQLKVDIITTGMEEKLYQVGLAGDIISLGPLQVTILAFSDVFPWLITNVLKKYQDSGFTEEEFESAKNDFVSSLYYSQTEQPISNLVKFQKKLLMEYFFLESELYDALEKISFEEFNEKVKNLYSTLYTEVLLVGNILDTQAKELSEKIVKALDYKPSKNDKRLENRVLDIVGHNLVLRTYNPASSGNQSFILNTYQDGVINVKNLTYIQLVVKVLDNEVYTYLRNERQICYVVQTFAERLKNVINLNIVVESHVLDAHQVDEEIEIALKRGEEKFEKLTDEEFKDIVASFNQTVSEKVDSIPQKGDVYLNHIVNHDYIFDQKERIINYLPKITKQGLLEYYRKLVGTPRKLSVQFYNSGYDKLPSDVLPKDKQFSKTEAKIIDDFEALYEMKRFPIDMKFTEELF